MDGQTWMEFKGIRKAEDAKDGQFVRDLAMTQGHSVAQQVS